MVYKKAGVGTIIGDFIVKLRKRGLSVDAVYLFGSHAWGKPTKRSDIDVAVISKRFKRWSDIKRIEFLSDIARYVHPEMDVEIDAVGFTPDELKNPSYFDLACEILQKGKIIYKKAA